MTNHAPTDEQSHILTLAKTTSANLMIDSYAGTGKTSTLELIESALPGPILYCVFNKKNADEATGRLGSTTTVRTMNGLGHRVWQANAQNKLVPNGKKCADILRTMIKEVKSKEAVNEMWEVFWPVIDGVARAKSLGYIPEGKYDHARRLLSRSEFHRTLEEDPDDLTADLIDTVLMRSINAAYKGDIDWNDQVYMPALFGGKFPKYPTLLIDEYQDLNPVNHVMIEKMMKSGTTRLFGVGDPCQNIYGFRGAKAQGMADAKAQFSMASTQLSISFRCPEAIVRHVHWRVPQFKWFKDGGHVSSPIKLPASSISDDAAVICRNNAPLFSLGLKLLASGRGVTIAGSDIGPKLTGIMKKLGGPSDLSQSHLLGEIEAWREAKLAVESTTANDLADCMKVFATFGSTKSQAILYADHLFSQKGTIQLMTGHKSKGLEFPNVFHLDPQLCRDSQQDKNVRYVISTRSSDKLTEILSNGIEW